MLLTILWIPLSTALICFFFGQWLGRHGTARILLCLLGVDTIFVWYNFLFNTINEKITYIQGFCWFATQSHTITTDLLVDNLTSTMFVVIITIAYIVHWYSYDYMYNDPHLVKFFAYLSLFTFFMLLLVAAADLTLLFMGWEGVGLCSYLLINFWSTRIQANKSALKAIFVNKIGDICLLFGFISFFYLTGTTNLLALNSIAPYVTAYLIVLPFNVSFSLYDMATLFFCFGAVGKSAQLSLHIWLPDAMEGPTPVSALLHAATMVTAGVFLVLRTTYIFEEALTAKMFLIGIGSLTAFFAATVGLNQYDIKRIIAFSTCSQLGYMFVACGLASYNTGIFHLFNHAFFKALLFLAAGSVIHSLSDEQDIRKMGALSRYLPLTFTFFIIASWSLMGVPYLSGFFSKDLIIESQAAADLPFSTFFYLLLLLAAFCTAAYSTRLLFFVFITRPRYAYALYPIFDSSLWVQLPLIFLATMSIFSGFFFKAYFIDFGTTFFSFVFYHDPLYFDIIQIEFIPYWFFVLPLIVTIYGSFYSYRTITTFFLFRYYIVYIYIRNIFFSGKWFFDKIYNTLLYLFIRGMLRHFYFFLDKGVIEFFGPTNFYKVLALTSVRFVKYQTGFLSLYIRSILAFFLIIPFILF